MARRRSSAWSDYKSLPGLFRNAPIRPVRHGRMIPESTRRRPSHFEPLEPRLLLSADPISAAQQAVLLDGLHGLADWLDDLDQHAQFNELLPIVTDTVFHDTLALGDVVDLGRLFRDHVVTPLEGFLMPFAGRTLDDLELFLEGLQAINGDVVSALSGGEITFDLEVLAKLSELPPGAFPGLEFDLAADAQAQGFSLDATATLTYDAQLGLNMVFGLDLTPGLSPQEAFFIRGAALNADITASAAINAMGRIGMLDVSIAGGTLNLAGGLDVGVLDPDASGETTLDELAGGSLSSLVSVALDGSTMLAINLPLSSSLVPAAPGGSSLTITDANPFDGIAPTVGTPGLSGFLDFSKLQPAQLLGLIEQLGSSLNGLRSSLNVPAGIPFVEETLEDIADFTQSFTDFVDQFFDPPPPGQVVGDPKFDTLAEFVDLLEAATGVAPGSIVPAYNSVSRTFTFDVNIERSFSRDILVDFSQGIGFLNVGGSAAGSFSIEALLMATVGMDLSFDPATAPDLNEFFFVADGAMLTASAAIELTAFQAAASLGILGLTLSGGPGTLATLGTGVTLSDGDGRVTVKDLLDDAASLVTLKPLTASFNASVNVSVDGGLDIGLPGGAAPAIVIGLGTPNDLASLTATPNADFGSFLDGFGDLSVDNILDAAGQLLGIIQGADFKAFDVEIPLLDLSINDILAIASRVQGAIDDVQGNVDNLAATVQTALSDLENNIFNLIGTGIGLEGNVAAQDELFRLAHLLEDLSAANASIPDPVAFVSSLISVTGALKAVSDALPVSTARTELESIKDDLLAALPSAQTLEQKLEAALNLGGSDTFDLEFGGEAVILRIGFDGAFHDDLGFSATLAQTGPLEIKSGGQIDLELTGDVQLDFGVDFSAGGVPSVFLLGTTGVALTAEIDPGTLTGTIKLGGIEATLGGSLTLLNAAGTGPASFVIDLAGGANDRVAIGDVPGDLSFTIDGEVNAAVDITIGAVTVPDAITATLDLNDITAPTFTVDPNLLAEILNGAFDFDSLFGGIQAFLDLLQTALGEDVLGQLPVIGDDLLAASMFLQDFETNVIDAIDDAIAMGGVVADFQQEIFDALGDASGIGILLDPAIAAATAADDPTDVGVILDATAGLFKLDLRIGSTEVLQGAFNLGLNAILFNLDASLSDPITLTLTWDVKLSLALDKVKGFYFDVSANPEITFGVEVTLPIGSKLTATFGTGSFSLLEIEATSVDVDADGHETGLSGELTVDIGDGGGDGQVTLSELGGLQFDPTLNAGIEVDLLLSAGIDEAGIGIGDGTLPRIQANFLLDDWNPFLGGTPDVSILDVSLNLGAFITETIGPVLDTLDSFLEPIKPIVEFLTTEIPVLSDVKVAVFGGGPITFLDAFTDALSFLGISGSGRQSIETVVLFLADVIEFIEDVGGLQNKDIILNFGDFSFTEDLSTASAGSIDIGDTNYSNPWGSLTDALNAATGGDQAAGESFFESIAGAVGSLSPGGLGISFPIIENPSNLIKLLMGFGSGYVDLITWDIPRLEAQFTIRKDIPIVPALISLFVEGSLAVTADFIVGLDTRGLQTGSFFDGFYFGNPSDPELTFTAGIAGGATLGPDAVFVRIQVEAKAGIEANIEAQWNDVEDDGKFYIDEVLLRASQGLDCIFDITGRITAFIVVTFTIEFCIPNPLPFCGDVCWGETTEILPRIDYDLAEFDFTGSCPELAPPDIASQGGDVDDSGSLTAAETDIGDLDNDGSISSFEAGVVHLHVGPLAQFRQPGYSTDIAETISVRGEFLNNGVLEVDLNGNGVYDADVIEVSGFGEKELFGPGTSNAVSVTGIIADGGAENDIITIDASVAVPVTVRGGSGDDIIQGGSAGDTLSGDDGADQLKGGKGADTIGGGASDDRIFGEQGDDRLSGDAGNDSLVGGEDDDTIFGGDNDDNAQGGLGMDTVFGDAGHDRLAGNQDDDELHGGTENDTVTGDAGADLIFGDAGDDFLSGEYGGWTDGEVFGHDTIFGGSGFDLIAGNGGDDQLHGEGDSDTIHGSLGNDSIFGGDADDELYAEQNEDYVEGNGGSDSIYGGDGIDRILGGSSVAAADAGDLIEGNGGDDVILGDNGTISVSFDVMTIPGGGAGSDTVRGGAGADVIFGGGFGDFLFGDDAVAGSPADDVVVGDQGEKDATKILAVFSAVPDSHGDDQITGQGGDDVLIGGLGDDVITGHGDLDIALGDDGRISFGSPAVARIETTDQLLGGSDVISGSSGDDTLLGGAADDDVFGSANDDIGIGDNGSIDYLLDGDLATLDRIEAADAVNQPTWDDVVAGGSGDDTLLGGVGPDLVTGEADADVALGDNGRLSFTGGLLRFIEVILPNSGDADVVLGGSGHDSLMGGTAGDELFGNENDDLAFGDHGLIDLNLPRPSGFFSIFTGASDGGARDTVHGNAGEDTLLGQQGDDLMFGDEDADDMIGGHNVAGGADELDAGPLNLNDEMDGGTGDDYLAGDNAIMIRRSDAISPRFRVLSGTTLYDAAGAAGVTTTHQANPSGTLGRDVTLLDHAAGTAAGLFGNDFMAGGADEDVILGQLGDDAIQGDGSIAVNVLVAGESVEAAGDGDDFIEGNGGADLIFGNLGQDDIIGGSSALFGLAGSQQRPDGTDRIFGGAGLASRIARNAVVGAGDPQIADADRHARDADHILGDNGAIYRIVGISGIPAGAFPTFNYDALDPARGSLRVIPRASDLLDYVPGAGDTGEMGVAHGEGDFVHAESGDDVARGMIGSDILFGDSEDDDLYGEAGPDWMTGGTGEDGALGDDGLLFTSRNGDPGEPLYAIAAIPATQLNTLIRTPGGIQQSIINVAGELRKSVDLTPFGAGDDDIIYGGQGDDFLHGGFGDDAISGAEALLVSATRRPKAGSPGEFERVEFDFGAPHNPGDALMFAARRADEFDLYDEFDPLREITLDAAGLPVAGGMPFLLNFEAFTDANDQVGTRVYDGNDALFGDLGNDWLVGGTGQDRAYGGYGADLINLDDNLATHGGANDQPDVAEFTGVNGTLPAALAVGADLAYGGAGRDVLIANSGADRLIDWVGEFNSYLVPFAPFGQFTVSRSIQPQLQDYLYDVSENDGADPTRAADTGSDPARNGEPEGELGLVLQKDFDWQDQTGAPDDPQAGNIPGGKKDVMEAADFNNLSAAPFAKVSGVWTLRSGGYEGAGVSFAEAISLMHVRDALPEYFEVLATVNAGKDNAGVKSNGFIIFDFQGSTDFKFAGVNIVTDKLVIGRRTAAGWIADASSNMQLRPEASYNLTLAVDGQVATLRVDGLTSLSHTFAPRIVEGEPVGPNSGMVGLATNNSVTRFDNVRVQKLPPASAFGFDPTTLFSARDGAWIRMPGGVLGAPPATGQPAITGLSLELETGSLLELEADVLTGALGGVVFDYYGPADFKFAALLADTDQLIIGHRTGAGWDIDQTLSRALDANTEYRLKVSTVGTMASVSLDGQAVLAHSFNGLLSDGGIGLISHGGQSLFSDLALRGSDPGFSVLPAPPAPPTGGGPTTPRLRDVADLSQGGSDWLVSPEILSIYEQSAQPVETSTAEPGSSLGMTQEDETSSVPPSGPDSEPDWLLEL